MPEHAIIGLDLGGTKLAGAIFAPTGRIMARVVVPLAGRGGTEVGALVCDQLRELLSTAERKRLRVASVGVSVPGISHTQAGTVWAPNIPGWDRYPLRRQILSALAGGKISVAIDSDRACYVMGEAWRGAARRCRNVIFLAVGTGIGAGILVDGQVLRGAHDVAGAIGWLALNRPYERHYGDCGCFEYHASGAGLAKVANAAKARNQGNDRRASAKAKPFTDAQSVFAAYERGDALATDVVGQAVEFWGMAVANLVSLFNPEKIILGGGVFGPARKLLPAIYAEARKWAQPFSVLQVKLEASKLGGDAGLYGAGRLALAMARKGE